jgi:predicted nuclease with TOPRIM domain
MADETKKPESGIAKGISLGKDLVALFRDAALLMLAVLLIALPETLNSMLVRAGFEEGSVVGFKWKSKLVNSDASLKEANATISVLQKKNQELSMALSEATAKANSPELKTRLVKLQAENEQLTQAVKQVQTSVNSTINSNAQFVKQALVSADTKRWAVVYSGDSSLEAAKYETETIARNLQLPNAAVYLRQGSYRSVSVVDDRSLAEEVLVKAKRRRQDAYIVSIDGWCPKIAERPGYFECLP